MTAERWILVSGHLEVSDQGRLRNSKNGRVYRLQKNHRGYLRCRVAGHKTTYAVHRLVAKAFCENPEGKDFVNHIDGDKENNAASNLEWVTSSENMVHYFGSDWAKPLMGEEHPMVKISEEDARWIQQNYRSGCRTNGRSALAQKFGVHPATIYKIASGRLWGHLRNQ